MAKNGTYNGQVAEALGVLDRPSKADKAGLARALAQVRGSGVISDAELIARYGESSHFAVDAELGRLTVASQAARRTTPEWLSQAQTRAKRLALPTTAYDDRWAQWKLAHTPNRSRPALDAEFRGKGGVGKKLGVVALQPSIRYATLTTNDHLHSKFGPWQSHERSEQTLELAAAHENLVTREGFEQTLTADPSATQAFYAYASDETTLIRAQRFMGSYNRGTAVFNRDKRAQLTTEQSLNLMQQTTFAVDPEWGDLLFEEPTQGRFERVEDVELQHDLGSFIASQEILTPLTSSLHVQQRYEIMQTRPA